jgi:benzoyl-CoA reductase/2-hydroxyglutaryl-CoA dehydratase subunit BcrC/BadD/HgdB
VKPKNSGAINAFVPAFKQYLADVTKSIDDGEPVVMCFPTFASEILLAFGIVPLQWEVILFLITAAFREGNEGLLDETEADGFPSHVCGFQRSPIKAVEKGLLPKPDLLLKCCSSCDSGNMTYQYAAHRFNVPLIQGNVPYGSGSRALGYFHDEIRRVIRELEGFLGRKIDADKLREHVEESNRQLTLFYKLQELRRQTPNPDPGMHQQLDTALLFMAGTNPKFSDYMQFVYNEAKARHERGDSFLPAGKKEIRTLWSGGFVTYMLQLPDILEDEFGMSYIECALSYLPRDQVGLVDTSTVDTMVEGLSRRMFNMPMMRNVVSYSDVFVNDMTTAAKSYHADAAVFAMHQGCRHTWAAAKVLSETLRDKVGIPSYLLEQDFCDKRFTPPASVLSQLREYFTCLS